MSAPWPIPTSLVDGRDALLCSQVEVFVDEEKENHLTSVQKQKRMESLIYSILELSIEKPSADDVAEYLVGLQGFLNRINNSACDEPLGMFELVAVMYAQTFTDEDRVLWPHEYEDAGLSEVDVDMPGDSGSDVYELDTDTEEY